MASASSFTEIVVTNKRSWTHSQNDSYVEVMSSEVEGNIQTRCVSVAIVGKSDSHLQHGELLELHSQLFNIRRIDESPH